MTMMKYTVLLITILFASMAISQTDSATGDMDIKSYEENIVKTNSNAASVKAIEAEKAAKKELKAYQEELLAGNASYQSKLKAVKAAKANKESVLSANHPDYKKMIEAKKERRMKAEAKQAAKSAKKEEKSSNKAAKAKNKMNKEQNKAVKEAKITEKKAKAAAKKAQKAVEKGIKTS